MTSDLEKTRPPKTGAASPSADPPDGPDPDGSDPRGSVPNPDPHTRGRRLWRGVWQWTLFIALIVAAATAVGTLRAPVLDGEAPDFTLETPGGDTLSLSDFRGRTVVLNFWATWCPPCRVELPSFARFARNNPDVAVLGLSVQSPPEDLRQVAADLPYPVLVVDAATAESYGVTSLPTTVVVTPEGTVRATYAGMLFGPQLWWLTR